ncbi:MAG: bacteriohemerythrin [Thiotrichales bacterium]|nr:MAG: bacteriohemerythrin [Thiotrichales bacterium]
MAHIQWSDELNTDIDVIDKQHKRIVGYINALEDVKGKNDRAVEEKVLNELVDYTLSHFAFEESLMEDADYGFINGHKRVHQLFVKRVSDFMQRFKMGEDVTEELLTVLKAWLINHIKSDDNDYADIVKKNLGNMDARKGDGWLSKSVKKFFG